MEAVNDLFNCLMGRYQVSTKAIEKAAGSEGVGADYKVSMPKANKVLDDGLEDIWGDATVAISNKASAGGKKDGDRQKTDSEPKEKKLKSSKREQELDSTEQAILKCKQFLTNLQNNETVLGITAKKHSQMVDLMSSRLSQRLLDMYAEDYQAEAGSEASSARDGMQLLEELRSLQQKLSSCEGLVKVLVTPKIEQEDFDAASKQALGAGISIVNNMIFKVWGNALSECFEKQDMKKWSKFLSVEGAPILPEVRNSLKADAIANFQEQKLVDTFVGLMKDENQLELIRTSLGEKGWASTAMAVGISISTITNTTTNTTTY